MWHASFLWLRRILRQQKTKTDKLELVPSCRAFFFSHADFEVSWTSKGWTWCLWSSYTWEDTLGWWVMGELHPGKLEFWTQSHGGLEDDFPFQKRVILRLIFRGVPFFRRWMHFLPSTNFMINNQLLQSDPLIPQMEGMWNFAICIRNWVKRQGRMRPFNYSSFTHRIHVYDVFTCTYQQMQIYHTWILSDMIWIRRSCTRDESSTW